MPILIISCPLGEDAPHDARNTRSAQQAFQTNFGQFGEVKDSGDKYGGRIQVVHGIHQQFCLIYGNKYI